MNYLAGVDEAGLGPILGPLVVGGVTMAGPEGTAPWRLLQRHVSKLKHVKGKVRGVARNIVFLSVLLFIHVVIWILMGVIVWAPRDPAGITALCTSAGLVAASAFAWVVLGREDVKAWVFMRWLRRTEHAEAGFRCATASRPASVS